MEDFPLIESAAADTTSPSGQEPPAHKRMRMSGETGAGAGFTFPQSSLAEKSGRRASGTGSIVHPSGRVLPLGIAQPIQSHETEQRASTPPDWEPKLTAKLGWAGGGRGGGDSGESEPLLGQEVGGREMGSKDDEEMVKMVMKQLGSDSSNSSESDSDTSSSDTDNASNELNTSPESEQHKYSQQQPGTEPQQQPSPEMTKTDIAALPRKSSIGIIHSKDSLPNLPGKEQHMFLSHSTRDQQAVKETIITPLRNLSDKIKMVACYHCMPDGRNYNDRFIERAMRGSCVILIIISPSYLCSRRCEKEWKAAVSLAKTEVPGEGVGQYQVIVAAVGKCSRPDPLKEFLYLDFIDKSKRHIVVDKLMKTLDTLLGGFLHCSPDKPLSETDSHSVEVAHTSSEDTPHTQHSAGYSQDTPHTQYTGSYTQLSIGGGPEYGVGVSEQHKQRMEEEFEAEFEAFDMRNRDGEHQMEMVPLPDPRKNEPAVVREDQNKSHSDSTAAPKEGGRRKRKGVGEGDMEEGEVSDSSSDSKTEVMQSKKVARFYDKLAKPDADKRDESPIFFMRNFNNWVKSILLRTYLHSHTTVLDLCCGKGGDLLKWKEGNIDYLVCADISETSVEACQGRYRSQRMMDRMTGEPPFPAEFHVADCCEVRLRDHYRNRGCRFQMVSCQFSVHYAFESYQRAHMMLRNACENLRPGGFFIGSTIDSGELVRRLREANHKENGSWTIENDIFSVSLDPSLDPWETLPLFGAKYNFKLHGVVNLPEFLVHFPLLVSMLEDFDMELVLQQNFYNFFSEQRHKSHNVTLMYKMQAFDRRSATMPAALWEAIGLYLVFVFQKKQRTHEHIPS